MKIIISPWIALATGIISGAGLAARFQFSFESWTPAVCGLGMAALLLLREQKWKAEFLFIFAFLYGASAMALDADQWSHAAWRIPRKTVILSGEVASFPEKSGPVWKWEFKTREFRMEEGPWQKTRGRVEVSIPTDEMPPLMGDRLILKGQIRFPARNEPGGVWTRRRLFLQNLQAQIRVKKFGDVIFDGWNPWCLPLRSLQLLRETWASQIERHYSKKHSAVLKALLLGMRMPDPELRLIFSRTGTSHLLSVSGFHTAVIAGIIFSGLILGRFSPAVAVAGASAGTLAYMALTGWGVAVQRAGLMAILVWCAWILGRPQTLIYWLNLALAGILWADPKKIWDISFQLSFLSMYGILLAAPRLKKYVKIPSLDVSLAAFLATYPAVLFHFQNFSWAGIFSNLIAVPVFAVILPLGFFSLMPGIGFLGLLPVRFLLTAVLWILKKIADTSWSCPLLPQPRPEWIFAYYLLGGILLWLSRPSGKPRLPSALWRG